VPASPNIRAAGFVFLSTGSFTLNDALTKFASQTMNMGEVMAVRGIFALALLLLLAWRMGVLRFSGALTSKVVALRTAADAAGTATYMLALQQIPLNNVVAIFQTLPLVVTLGSAVFLGEQVGWRRMLAIAFGFCGVMLIIRPGMEGFNAFGLLVLASVFFCSIRDLATRRIPLGVSTVQVSAVTAATIMVLGAILAFPLGGWKPVTGHELLVLFIAAIAVIGGYLSLISAMRIGDISFVAPFRYLALIWSGMFAFLFFAEIPDALTLAGAAMIAASGLYTLNRERIRSRMRAAAEAGQA
jgi:drug/metabolite transporter (DMT)-like permease